MPPVGPGARLAGGRYELLKLLGSGGWCDVYAASQAELGRLVALKVLREGPAAGAAEHARMVREARTAGALRHPGIVPVFDSGDEAGTPWIAMELVEGPTLRALLRQGLPWPRALELLTQVAEAAAFAHQAGVTHRDLKPENVLVGPDGRARVADWGLARATRDATGLTRTGTLVGTPAYLSPEQLDGRAGGPAADGFALGVMAFEAAAGHLPWGTGGAGDGLLAARVSRPPPPLAAVCPSASRRLACLVDGLLDRDPSARPPLAVAATELALCLGEARMATTQSAAPFREPGPAPAAASQRPGPRRWAAPAALLALGVAAGAALVRPPLPPRDARSVAGELAGSLRDDLPLLRDELLARPTVPGVPEAALLGQVVARSGLLGTLGVAPTSPAGAVGLLCLAREAARRQERTTGPAAFDYYEQLVARHGAQALGEAAPTLRAAAASATTTRQLDALASRLEHLRLADPSPELRDQLDVELARTLLRRYQAGHSPRTRADQELTSFVFFKGAPVPALERAIGLVQPLFTAARTSVPPAEVAALYLDLLLAQRSAAAKEGALAALPLLLQRAPPTPRGELWEPLLAAASLASLRAREYRTSATGREPAARGAALLRTAVAACQDPGGRALLTVYLVRALTAANDLARAKAEADGLRADDVPAGERWRHCWAVSLALRAAGDWDGAERAWRQGYDAAVEPRVREYFLRRIHEAPVERQLFDPGETDL